MESMQTLADALPEITPGKSESMGEFVNSSCLAAVFIICTDIDISEPSGRERDFHTVSRKRVKFARGSRSHDGSSTETDSIMSSADVRALPSFRDRMPARQRKVTGHPVRPTVRSSAEIRQLPSFRATLRPTADVISGPIRSSDDVRALPSFRVTQHPHAIQTTNPSVNTDISPVHLISALPTSPAHDVENDAPANRDQRYDSNSPGLTNPSIPEPPSSTLAFVEKSAGTDDELADIVLYGTGAARNSLIVEISHDILRDHAPLPQLVDGMENIYSRMTPTIEIPDTDSVIDPADAIPLPQLHSAPRFPRDQLNSFPPNIPTTPIGDPTFAQGNRAYLMRRYEEHLGLEAGVPHSLLPFHHVLRAQDCLGLFPGGNHSIYGLNPETDEGPSNVPTSWFDVDVPKELMDALIARIPLEDFPQTDPIDLSTQLAGMAKLLQDDIDIRYWTLLTLGWANQAIAGAIRKKMTESEL